MGIGGVLVVLVLGCGARSVHPGDVGDGDIGSDADTDTDADSVSDGDSDSDSDSDSDTSSETETDTGSDSETDTASAIEPEDPYDCERGAADVAPVSDAWTIENLLDADVPSGGDIVVEPDGTAHLLLTSWYLATETVELRYGTYSGGAFTDEVLQSAFTHAYENGARIALDSAGRPHVAWPGFEDSTLYHGVDDLGWSFETVVASSTSPGLAVGPDDVVHVVYLLVDDADLWSAYYANDETGWVAVNLGWTGIGGSPAIAICPDGAVHVVYERCLDADGDPCIDDWTEPYQVQWATNESGAWETETIAWDLTALTSLALACDGDGVHLAWSNGWHVRYATRSDGDWEIEWIDHACESGAGAVDLALDASGNPHVVYTWDYSDRGSLRHATRAGGAWSAEIVDPEVDVGQLFPRIDVDGSDVAHVVYDWREGDASFRYGVRDGG